MVNSTSMSGAQTTTMPRWVSLVGGTLGSTTCGFLLYAWSVFIAPLNKEFGWSSAEIALAFALCCFVFGMVAIPAGRISDKIGPRKVVLVGGLLLTVGFVASGFIHSKWALYFTYGIVAGLGGGMVYLPPIATAPKWWPDRRALAIGFTVVGLGLGSFVMAPLATYIIGAPNLGWRYVFIFVGIAMGIMTFLSAMCLQVPPPGWKPTGWNPPAPEAGVAASSTKDFTHEEAKATPQFWLLYFSYFCGSFAGLLVIGHIAAHGIDKGLDRMTASYAVSALAIANAAVRMLIDGVVDKIGTKKCFLGVFGAQVVAMLMLYPAGSTAPLLWACAALVGWNYGFMFTLFPATCLQYYGATAQGANYGLLFSAWGIAGALGPFVGGWLKDVSGTYYVPFLVGAVVVAISVVILATLKPPSKK